MWKWEQEEYEEEEVEQNTNAEQSAKIYLSSNQLGEIAIVKLILELSFSFLMDCSIT